MEATLGQRLTTVIAHHALTPLADGSEANYRLIRGGRSGVTCHAAGEWALAEDFMAALLPASLLPHPSAAVSLTRAEAMALHSIRSAMSSLDAPLPAATTLLVVSTTKGNVELLRETPDAAAVRLGYMARTLSRELGLTLPPLVVSNACTSGVCAIIAAQRALAAGECTHAIVCGIEAQSRFIVSGFQSFHALSPEACRPFSKNRCGLNVGEAAATIILTQTAASDVRPETWVLRAGAIRNDANHISGPSRTGEGSYRALCGAMSGAEADEMAFVSVHGTATPYNDEMESIAIERAGLLSVPVGSLKGYYGHTMGAAGVLETILSMLAAEDNTVLATHGYDGDLGVSRPVSVSSENRTTDRRQFLKLISGFGGVNAAIRMERISGDGEASEASETSKTSMTSMASETSITSISSDTSSAITPLATITITPTSASLNGCPLPTTQQGDALLTELYRMSGAAYPKYFKMDGLSRLGFVAAEHLLSSLGEERFVPRDDRAIVLVSAHGCLATDRHYETTIVAGDNYFPSPAVFVYTLPNIVTGEIAIRNKYLGETSMYIIERDDDYAAQMQRIAAITFQDPATTSALMGWVDYASPSDFLAELKLITIK